MTVETQTNFVILQGDGIAVTFPFTFPVYDASHIAVYAQDTTTKAQVLVSPSAYSVTGIGDPDGGSVVFGVAPVSTNKIILARLVPLHQDADILNQGGFYPATVEQGLDILEMQIQQTSESAGRAIRGQLGEVFPTLPPAPLRAGQLIGFSDDANAYPVIADGASILRFLAGIITAGSGIELSTDYVSAKMTIINSSPAFDAWLLETGVEGGSGTEIFDKIVSSLRGNGCVIVTDNVAGTVTVDLTQDVTAEIVRDAVGAALVAGSGIAITVNDVANTITISADTASFGELARDAIGTALVAGNGINIVVDDAGDTITINTQARILAIASAATVTPTFSYDQVNVTAQAAGLTIANPTGTPVDGYGFIVRVKDNGTARPIAFGTKYRAFNDPLPTTTFVGKTMYIGCVYNAADDTVDVLCVRNQA